MSAREKYSKKIAMWEKHEGKDLQYKMYSHMIIEYIYLYIYNIAHYTKK